MHTPDMLIHVHPDLSAEGRAKLEEDVMDCKGVIAAHFNRHAHPHERIVVYNPDAITGRQILATVQNYDPTASMAGCNLFFNLLKKERYHGKPYTF